MILTTIIYGLIIFTLICVTIHQVNKYTMKIKQNNDLAVRHRNIAILSAYLCVTFVSMYIITRNEFLSVKPLNSVYETRKINATEHAYSWTNQGLTRESCFYLKI